MADAPNHKTLETFDNPRPGREYEIKIEAPEFTCICPKTGHPDFATMTLLYVPDKKCVELKSYKLYVQAWRNVGIFHEAVTNQIADDLVKALDPIALSLEGAFHAHGGISTSVMVEYDRPFDEAQTSPKKHKK
ncbi:MAG: preQ(1) synthase [Planctomycetes bacterium]|nr:preQ(1) synthase [Planctomycetota bacterium]NUQ34461.1 NADPH-dependent 7-cyano-7-deazaguanine reductase QueF [Planctomycetaceae bacterium]